MSRGIPAGCVLVTAGRTAAVAVAAHEGDARALLAEAASVYEAAARTVGARVFHGRGPAYGIVLPVSRVPAVVRRNRHGGALATLTGDRFLAPTRAPHEMDVSRRLRDAGVRTPDVLLYSLSPALPPFVRADVVTREVGNGRELASFLTPDTASGERAAAWQAALELVTSLAGARARHADLNAKNILVAPEADTFRAWALDVDRVEFVTTALQARRANAARLARSVRKWVRERGAVVLGSELEALEALAG